MNAARPRWTASLEVRAGSKAVAGRWRVALGPESQREIPRATARIGRIPDATVRVHLEAPTPGALRAAVNTYLGWFDLLARASQVAESPVD
ncbi:MAG TPA: CTAG/PCC1 family protein [Thermoplasmata archaeon]|nr:CTAG/PCC1 family protein [Thermoplasmata archaeon]